MRKNKLEQLEKDMDSARRHDFHNLRHKLLIFFALALFLLPFLSIIKDPTITGFAVLGSTIDVNITTDADYNLTLENYEHITGLSLSGSVSESGTV